MTLTIRSFFQTAALRQAIDTTKSGLSSAHRLMTASRSFFEDCSAINLGTEQGPNLQVLFQEVAEKLTPGEADRDDLDALQFYLALHANTMAANVLLYAPPLTTGRSEIRFAAVQALAGAYLLNELMDRDATEGTAKSHALQQLRTVSDATIADLTAVWARPRNSKRTMERSAHPHPEVVAFLREAIGSVRKKLSDHPHLPVVRLMAAVHKEVERCCQERKLPNHVLNLTIGDVNPASLPPELRERMALDPYGPKALEVDARAATYRRLALQGGVDCHRYDIKALGWPALRAKFIEYAASFGLYKLQQRPAQSLIAAGGGQGLMKALLIARQQVDPQWDKEGRKVEVHFSNPGLRMLANNARKQGFKVLEPEAKAEYNFFPDAASVRQHLASHPNCKILIYTPMGNPNGALAEPEQAAALLEVLHEHGVVLINDFAYLGMGNLEITQRLGKILGAYTNRIDVVPMTKIFGDPGLRCSGLITPDSHLATHFPSIAQDFQPTESYAMQSTALAIWDLVTLEDRLAMAQHFQTRQGALIDYLRKLDTTRRDDGKPPLIDFSQPVMGDASLYVLAPLAEGIDPLTFIEETGIIGTPAAGFFSSGRAGYIRFAIGVEEINFIVI